MAGRTVLWLLVVAVSMAAYGRTVVPSAPDADAYIALLENNGYEVKSFDISQLADTTYSLKFYVREYENGNLVDDGTDTPAYGMRNRTMLSDFPADDQQEIIREGSMADSERGIYRLERRINIGFMPPADSTRKITIMLPEVGTRSFSVKLREQTSPDASQTCDMYGVRPFKMQQFRTGEFIPLVLLGSFWWDDRYHFYRFCGENELEPDMSNEMTGKIPHYFVIGMEATKID